MPLMIIEMICIVGWSVGVTRVVVLAPMLKKVKRQHWFHMIWAIKSAKMKKMSLDVFCNLKLYL